MIELKKIVISFLIIGVTVSLGIIGSKYFNKDEKLNSNETLISYYVETGEGTGVYEKQESTTWPEGYVLNEEKSSCDNGSTLSWDSETNSVVVTASKEDSCKVYMDIKLFIAEFLTDGFQDQFIVKFNDEYINDFNNFTYKAGDSIIFRTDFVNGEMGWLLSVTILDINQEEITTIELEPCKDYSYILSGKESYIRLNSTGGPFRNECSSGGA